MKKSRPEPSLRAQWIGKSMRELRKRRRIPQAEASSHIQRDPSMLGRYENGEIPFRREDLLSLLDYYGVSSERERDSLLQLCDDIWRKDWWDDLRDDLGTDFINVPWLESRVDRINTYQHFLVPGLLQTRDYAEVLIRKDASKRTSEDQIERWIDVRMGRQQVLQGDHPIHLTVVMEEVVIQRPIGGSEILRDQLHYLLDVSKLENVCLRVIPTRRGEHAAYKGSFEHYEMPEPYPDVAYLDTLGGSLYVEEPTVGTIRDIWNDVSQAALSASESVSRIEQHLEELT